LVKLSAGNSIEYKNGFDGNVVFLVNIDGEAMVEDTLLSSRDALGISETNSFVIEAKKETSLLAIEIPRIPN
jgi:hypothetical protein